MKTTFALSCLALGTMLLLPSLGMTGQNETSEKSAKVRKITGCVAKGDSENEYQLTTAGGNTWEVKTNDAVDLAGHVGHTVTLTGTVNNADLHAAKEKAKEKTMDNPNEHGHLTPTAMKMVAESCKK
jgi:hypothetical protein